MLMAYRVNERALEFNEYFLCEMLGSSNDNRMHLELARSALRDILRTELTERQRELLILYQDRGEDRVLPGWTAVSGEGE